jgi:ABC-2 type transport system ATP-binding protein
MEYMITYSNVVKQYGALTAVDGFSLRLRKGEFFGLLGPNGAGKTTIMRMTAALTRSNSGSIEIDGESIHRNRTKTKQKIGIVPQYSNLEAELSAWENLEYHGRLYGMKAKQRRERIAELLQFAELGNRAKNPAKSFSGGMQRRLMLIKALMHNPEILLLDEPTVGLDPGARRKIWELLRGLSSQGLTIFLTTHYLEEAQSLCGRVGLLNQGKLIRLDSPAAIIKEVGSYVLETYNTDLVAHNQNNDVRIVHTFFKLREDALRAAESSCEFIVRETNLEDAFLFLTNKEPEKANSVLSKIQCSLDKEKK